ncbi:NAD-dependent epimerase/dehydratase family protein [Dyadobacter sp. 32]|uniref:NAD-dependent epimerase/dehydratase family protein n=1 Tax=Dyadobacter sp. 32 TaxID=538966 RepID=UPI0011EC65C5
METAGIIGGGGFIGSYITKTFLTNGFKVKVLPMNGEPGVRHGHMKGFAQSVEICTRNVTDKKALREFVNGCHVVIHGGAPLNLDIREPKIQIVESTITETENLLEVVKNTPGIRKVVLMTSVPDYNTNFGVPAKERIPYIAVDKTDPEFTHQTDHSSGRGKFIYNQVIEKFLQENPNLPFEVCSVSPTLVIGNVTPCLQDQAMGGSGLLFKNKIADPFVQMLYDMNLPVVVMDAETIAEAVYKTAISSGLHGKNFLLSGETFTVSDLSRMVNQQEPVQEGNVIYLNKLRRPIWAFGSGW